MTKEELEEDEGEVGSEEESGEGSRLEEDTDEVVIEPLGLFPEAPPPPPLPPSGPGPLRAGAGAAEVGVVGVVEVGDLR